MLDYAILSNILDRFGLTFSEVTNFYDTSHGENDQRFNYILDENYVLKIHSPNSLWEERLQEISRLIERYRAIGVYCPRMIPTLGGPLSCPWEIEGRTYTCFVEEYAIYPVCRGEIKPPREEVIRHLGVLAAAYTDVDLSPNYSMWSIIDLCPLDAELGFDEKQDNANDLIKTLREVGLPGLARQVSDFNDHLREVIVRDYKALPRCVYQGDLNPWNELHSDGHFAGLIDFNLSGTDVNINIFLNETDSYLDQDCFDVLSVSEIIDKNDAEQEALLSIIYENYALNELEKRLLPYYKWIVDLFQHPNSSAMCNWLKDDTRRDKCTELITALINKPL